jgi:hypothetical protein
MPTYTPSGRTSLQDTGSNNNTWGIVLNQQGLALIDTQIDGISIVTITGDHVLTSLNGQADESRAKQLRLTGSPAANFSVTTPNVPKTYIVENLTGKIATFTTGSGSTVAIDTSDVVEINTDGADWKTLSYGGLSLKAYISAVAAGGAGTVPSPIGNDGKFLTNNGTIAFWDVISALQLSDYNTKILGVQVALAVAL